LRLFNVSPENFDWLKSTGRFNNTLIGYDFGILLYGMKFRLAFA
jgi:hypothetical protein